MTEARAEVTIQGTSALLMHAFPMTAIEGLEKRSPEEQAELAAYRDPDTGNLYFPGLNLQRSLVAGAVFSKGKGPASLQKPVAACVFVAPERIPLPNGKFEVDSRPVVVPATRGRVLRHRPRLDSWGLAFTLEWDPLLLTEAQIRRVVDDTGSRVGIGDFRPEKKGPFGRFLVVRWQT